MLSEKKNQTKPLDIDESNLWLLLISSPMERNNQETVENGGFSHDRTHRKD